MAAPGSLNNPTLYNAALAGMVVGLETQRRITNSTASSYDSIVQAAKVFAVAVDTAITALANLSSGNATIVPSTAAIADVESTRPALLQGLCQAYWSTGALNGNSTDTTAGTYATAVAAIVAEWTQVLTELSSA